MEQNKPKRRRKVAGAAVVPDVLPAEPMPAGALAAGDDELDEFDQATAEEQQRDAEEARWQRLDTLGAALGKKRQAAVNARQQSGIEQIWVEDEEFYEGIDDANRDEQVTTLKPRDFNNVGGRLVSSMENAAGTTSTVFLNITRSYVDYSAGRAGDMLLPTDDRNWDLKETPIPDVIGAISDETPLRPDLQKPGMTTIGQAAQQMINEAKGKVAKAKKRIEDWHDEGQYHAEQRKVLADAAKVGTGILKGPFPVKRTARAVLVDPTTGDVRLEVQMKTAPVSKCISYWNLYPDPACGDNIHNGSYVWERDRITARQLRDLQGTVDSTGEPMYLDGVIDICLKEGPQRHHADEDGYQAPDTETFDIWYYNGVATAEDLRAAGLDADEGEIVPVVITMVNDRVIKAEMSTLETGEFPYDVMVWQPREGHWAGIGVARQVRTPQRMINAGTRNLLDNAGLGAGPQIVMLKGAIKPMGAGAKYNIRPRKMWEMDPDSDIDDVRKAFAAIEIPMVTQDLMAIIQFALKMAEDVTGLPMLLQGQQGRASETVGGMQILNQNSNTPLRAIAKQYDDRITVPHIKRYYQFLLEHGPDAAEKGEFVIAARGSSALFERDAQNQAILQMAPLVKDPDFKINPAKWFTEFLRAQRLSPEDFQYSDLEWKQLQDQMKNAPQPKDPRIEAAEIAAETRKYVADRTAEVAEKRIATDMDRDTVYAETEKERERIAAEAADRKAQRDYELALLKYANDRQISLTAAKKDLAKVTMQLNTQRELAQMNAHGPQVATPATEPPARAKKGQAFQA